MHRPYVGTFAGRLVRFALPRRWASAWPPPGLPAVLGLLAGAVAWELGGQLLDFTFLPPLSNVFVRLAELIGDGTIPTNLAVTLRNLAIGTAISFSFGVVIGVLMGRYWRIDAALDVYVIAILTAPTLAFAPVFYSIFGLGSATPIGVLVMYSIPMVILNTRAGVQEVDRSLLEMSVSFGARERDQLWLVRLPAATPYILAGIRLATPAAVKGAINGEMFIAVIGLGGVIVQAGRTFDATTVLAILLVFIVFALVLAAVTDLIDRRLTSWLPPIERH